MKKAIMTRAWQIAREAVKKFGGKIKMYFAETLKIAWCESKKAFQLKKEEEIKMNGTEKQVKWAKDILKKITAKIDEIKVEKRKSIMTTRWENKELANAKKDEILEKAKIRINALNDAKYIIDYRSDFGSILTDLIEEISKDMKVTSIDEIETKAIDIAVYELSN